MSIQLIKPHHFLAIVFLSMVALTFILADYSFAQRERRDGDSSRVSREDDRRGSDAPRVSGQRERRGSDAPRVSKQRERRGSDAPRVTEQRSKRRIISPRVTRYGHVVRKLPRGYRRVWHRDKPYFYFGGVFYLKGPSGFVSVSAPIGAVIVSLPIGYTRVWVGSSWYYTYGGVFYRRAPSGYVVVNPPVDVILEEEVPIIVQPSEAASGQVSVTASILNVRSGPGLHFPLIYQVHRGYILEVHGQSREWLYVELPNGEFGWVMTDFTYRLEAPGSG
ncbi:MAG: SH3 domain-containing protein [Nitrospiraceae bacterium]|nr:MAG: SH3 domain-containing protein [Nitrospiraceae bacterium]